MGGYNSIKRALIPRCTLLFTLLCPLTCSSGLKRLNIADHDNFRRRGAFKCPVRLRGFLGLGLSHLLRRRGTYTGVLKRYLLKYLEIPPTRRCDSGRPAGRPEEGAGHGFKGTSEWQVHRSPAPSSPVWKIR
eukprot:scaffold7095_cov260-Pinguiococcus_pyrenoidosus.AAC.19